MIKYLLAVVLLCSVGCSTRSPVQKNYTVPPGRTFDGSVLRPSPKRNCAITIVRESGVIGSGLNIYLDGNQLARMNAGESITACVKPGRHRVSLRPLFSPSSGKLLVLKARDKAALRVVDRDDNFQLQIVGRDWLASTKSWLHWPFAHRPSPSSGAEQ